MALFERIQSQTGDAKVTDVLDPIDAATPRDALALFKGRLSANLQARMGQRLFDPSLTEHELREFVITEINSLMTETRVPLSDEERHQLVSGLVADVLGFGPVEVFIADPSVTEIMVNSTDPIFVERRGRLEETNVRFRNAEHLLRVIDRIVTRIGRRIDEASPMVDARLPDGSRVNAIIPPLAVDGPALTIRKFSREILGVDELIEYGTLTHEAADFLSYAVEMGITVLVSGGTGTGKTTVLNVLSSQIPEDERIITIEDAVELQLKQKHVVRLESRPANIEGSGEVTIRTLVRNALRMRPDRIIVGEVRGAEALDMLQAVNTGHDGSLCTIHANSPRDALSRLETMVLMAGFDLPLRAVREQIASGIDLVVQLQRQRDGSRKMVQISEVVGMEGDVITMNDLFEVDGEGDGTGVLA
ncbi:MAG: CpaF family protein, partial [Actinomycetota bacterium]